MARWSQQPKPQVAGRGQNEKGGHGTAGHGGCAADDCGPGQPSGGEPEASSRCEHVGCVFGWSDPSGFDEVRPDHVERCPFDIGDHRCVLRTFRGGD